MARGQLFTRDFLERGITETGPWRDLPDVAVDAFAKAAHRILGNLKPDQALNEANTEDKVIKPILDALGWGKDHLSQMTAARKGRSDVPDMLLFASGEALESTKHLPAPDAYKHGLSFVESKKWCRPLDRKDGKTDDGVPSTQMLRYLNRVMVMSDGRILWGILTNGRHWRLYWQNARSQSEDFLELDLPSILGLEGFSDDLFAPAGAERPHWLKVFLLIFGRGGFLPLTEGKSFHQIALDEGKLWEEKVAEDLSNLVFDKVFPRLTAAIYQTDPLRPESPDRQYLDEVRQAALILLYRLLFVLYAEDRNLLPARDKRYDDYGMRKRVREDIRRRKDEGDTFAEDRDDYYSLLRKLFASIAKGSKSLGLPPYNGGLFDEARTPLLGRVEVPDSVMADVIDALSRPNGLWVNYRDLSVQQLGSIYERLLEHEVVIEAGAIRVRPNPFARKSSGSYYTPEDLVHLIIERTIGPLLDERRKAFEDRIGGLAHDKRPAKSKLAELAAIDPATAMLDLKVCDPAMGSGHFLVSLVDYLADRILTAIAESAALADEAGLDYESPLANRVASIRDHIWQAATDSGWAIRPENLDDRLIVRRMILKRVVFGVDKNPMAVELAKVSLWLHTFTVGAPLSFLDHHLRCGDSLFGEWVRPLIDELESGHSLLINPYIQQATAAVTAMSKIEEITDSDITEVTQSRKAFGSVEEATEALTAVMDFRHGLRWLGIDRLTNLAALESILGGGRGDLLKALRAALPAAGEAEDRSVVDAMLKNCKARGARATKIAASDVKRQADALIRLARDIVAQERFLHWQVAFPGVWSNWTSAEAVGGFDAVIGNPPWDRIKLQEVEWFAARKPEIALAQTAAQRGKMAKALEANNDPLFADYRRAQRSAEAAADVARSAKQYPLLSSGDINIYSLFVERALALIKSTGMVGLLTPSGIAADKGASEFFRRIGVGGRLSALFDFENRGIFFPDVHNSFKFCALVVGGSARRFDGADCAFYLHSVATLADPDRCFRLRPADFAAVNPNTGTAPIFRTRRDAELTTTIYQRVPVLVDRSGPASIAQWPVRYVRMFDMTNDSALFRTAAQLEADGCYRIAGNHWKKGKTEYLPLYVGRMIHQFDHRAASVAVNEDNVHNPNVTAAVEIALKQNSNWSPTPPFWVSAREQRWPARLPAAIGFRDIARATDARTVIATFLPPCAAGNTLPLILPGAEDSEAGYRQSSPLWLANLNSFALDYVARQKVQSTHLNWYIAEQLPVIPPAGYDRRIGAKSVEQLARAEVIKLTYTAEDMRAFAKDQSYDGEPFPWNEEDRRHSRARLDALFFMLYGLAEPDADYILSTFPIVREQDEATHGRYLTRDLIVAYMRAFKAGDTETRVAP
ncbi:MAG TPA: restriction endonuclease [Alphaproteobacteria bacterium]|nr:restriction endonuclease [Alphaproteobacteria bacterium]